MLERSREPVTQGWIETDSYIFDIDGTLLNAYGGAHYNAFHSTLKTFFGLDCKIDGVPLHGNTDIGILRAVLARERIAVERFDSRRDAILSHMCQEVLANVGQMRAELCPGILQFLENLTQKAKLLGLASGNLEKIGWLKVRAAGIGDFFSFGAFSDGHETREEIFCDAADQVRRRIGLDATYCFIGDTPQDILAARAIGGPVIAVATGIYSAGQLQKHTPDLCLSSCEDVLEHFSV